MATYPSFVKRFCKQTAVYWGNPVENGFGGKTFDIPYEIKCLWTSNEILKVFEDGKEIIQVAEILVIDDLQVQGFLYLGYLTDLEEYLESDNETINPLYIEKAYEITEKKDVPWVSNPSKFVRTVTVGYSNILRTKKQYATRD